MLFLQLLRWSYEFVLYSVHVVYYISLFSDVKSVLLNQHSWDKAHLVMVCNSLYIYIYIFFAFKEQFQVHSKVERKVQRFSIYLLPPQVHSLPHYQHPPSEWYSCYNWWSYIDIMFTQCPIVYIQTHSLCCTINEFGQMYVHVYICVCIYMGACLIARW